MRRLLVFTICFALAIAGCAQESSDTSVGDPVTTTVAVDATSGDAAAEATEAFNSSMAIIVELSVLLSDEFEALKASMKEHSTELSEGEAIDTCCGAHFETLRVYDRSIGEEIGSVFDQIPNLTPWLEELSDSLPDGQQGLTENVRILEDAWVDLSIVWRGIARGGDTFDIDSAVDLLDECKALAGIITEFGESCCTIALDT
jgi:hypothetical protein